mmetsp:Transcript_11829/g.17701  ORF Transcript_11829/g.17701 Transcript_11829/m.17701 type:complete len:324 (-) Transcript_11829:67-1038(-)
MTDDQREVVVYHSTDNEDVVLRSSERVARNLILNTSPSEVSELLETVRKIVLKIIENPDEEKYRKLRKNSKLLSNKILSKAGGRELMGWLGFESKDEIEPKIELRKLPNEKERLEAAIMWINSYKPRDKDAELSIRLPNGTSIRAGFSKHETIRDVLNYVERFHAPSLTGNIILSISRPLRKFESDDDLNLSLAQAALLPRAALLAIHADTQIRLSAAEQAAEEARRQALKEQAQARREQDEKERKLRQDKLNRKRDLIQQRADALRHFSSDREDKNERTEREKQRRLHSLHQQQFEEEEAEAKLLSYHQHNSQQDQDDLFSS